MLQHFIPVEMVYITAGLPLVLKFIKNFDVFKVLRNQNLPLYSLKTVTCIRRNDYVAQCRRGAC